MNETIYMNRELSWLKFNERVLEEAENPKVPLCERLTFASIYQSNLDEFFMVRVGSLIDQMLVAKDSRDNKTHMTPKEQIQAILPQVEILNRRKDEVYGKLMEKIEEYGVRLVDFSKITEEENKFLEAYFDMEISGLISPTIVGKRQPFPFLKNKEIYAVVVLTTKSGKERLGIIPCGSGVFERLIHLPGGNTYMLSEELILHYIPKVFKGYQVKEKSLLRVTRNADIDADALYDEDLDYREFMADLIKKRKKLAPVRIELSRKLSEGSVKLICEHLAIKSQYVFHSQAPLDLSFVFQIEDALRKIPELFYERRTPRKSPAFTGDRPILDQIKEKDKLLSYPYESINPFLNMLHEAANDKEVVSIKMTLYRVAKQSKVVEALIEAAENGKEVLVLVELKARFDEENNIIWARKLEKAGCHVIYGLLGLKTHSKITEIVRREEDGIRRYVHLGTGNYNDITANFYTDMGLLTCSKPIGDDAGAFFNMISGFSEPSHWNKLILAPLWLRKKTEEMIEREIKHAKEGRKARIVAKVNSLVDPKIIELLYKASCSGVKIDLIVRGICALRAGVKDLSENITVRSIIGRYLEHTRIYYFYNDGQENVFCASADWMQRNLNRRVEIMFPIDDENLKKEVINVLDVQLSDTMRAHIQHDGVYTKDRRGKKKLDCQEYCMEQAVERANKVVEKKTSRVFIPKMKPEEE